MRGPLLEDGNGVGAGVVELVQYRAEGGPGVVGEDVGGVDFAAGMGESGAHPLLGLFGGEWSAVDVAAVVVFGDDGGEAVEFGQRVAEGLGGREFGAFATEDGEQGAFDGGGFAVAVEQVAGEFGGFVGVQDGFGVEVGVVAVDTAGTAQS